MPIFQQFDQALGKIADRLAVSPNLDTEGVDKYIQFESTPHASGSRAFGAFAPNHSCARHGISIGLHQSSSGFRRSPTTHSTLPAEGIPKPLVPLGLGCRQGHIRTFGCDRIHGIDVQEDAFKWSPRSTQATTSPMPWASRSRAMRTGRRPFECDPLLAKYLTSQPLHHSQTIVEEDGTVTGDPACHAHV